MEGELAYYLDRLGLQDAPPQLAEWEQMVDWVKNPEHEVTLAIIGKYTENGDAYISVAEAVRHGGIHNHCRVNIRWLEAADIDGAGDWVFSLSVGLFGFRESISASYVVQSLALESVTVIILLAWTMITATAVAREHKP